MLNTEELYWPDGQESRYIDWSEQYTDGEPRYRWVDTFEFEHDGEYYTLLASDGDVVAAVVDDTLYSDGDLTDAIGDTFDATLAALSAARDEGSAQSGAEGPMMNYFWPVHNRGNLEEMAVSIADLPLCVVEFEDSGEIGLALTGGGMDLSWEIAEAYIRLGYRPPVSLDLPGMSGRGESEHDQDIVQAVVDAKQARAANLAREADSLIRKYLA